MCAQANVGFASVESLVDDIELALQRSRRPALRSVRVDVDATGVVTVSGHVRSYYDRQIAVREARRLCGDQEIRDDVRVICHAPNA